jgi:hypothetical protein
MIIAETIEQIPCGSINKEVYVSRDSGDMYITYEDTSIWDPSSIDTSIVIDTVAHTLYKVICMIYNNMQWCAVVYNVMQRGTMVQSGRQWSSGESYTLT